MNIEKKLKEIKERINKKHKNCDTCYFTVLLPMVFIILSLSFNKAIHRFISRVLNLF